MFSGIFYICVLLSGLAEYFRCTKGSSDFQGFLVPPNGQGNDGDTGKNVDDYEEFKHCCWMVSKLFACVNDLLYGGADLLDPIIPLMEVEELLFELVVEDELL